MASFAELSSPQNYRTLLAPLAALAQCSPELSATSAGRVTADGADFHLLRFHFCGAETGIARIRIGLFAGVHGDEPAGCLALVRFLTMMVDEPSRFAGYDIFAYPVVNPWGFNAGARANVAGIDLNREFWRGSAQPEVRFLERDLRDLHLHGLIALHADDTSVGHYGFAHGRTLDEALLERALHKADDALPRDRRGLIDGFAAEEGIIDQCYPGILGPPPGQDPHPFNIIFETPAGESLARQVAAHVAALDAILATYRELLAFSPNL